MVRVVLLVASAATRLVLCNMVLIQELYLLQMEICNQVCNSIAPVTRQRFIMSLIFLK